MKTWKELKIEIDRATEETILSPDPEMVAVFQYRISTGGAGLPHDNQIYSTWHYGGADVTYIADWCYFLLKLSKDEDYSLGELRTMARFWFVQPSHFGNYCGMRRQYSFIKQIADMLDSLEKDAFVALIDSLRCYIMNLCVWLYQLMPWGVGYALPVKDKAFYEAALKLA
jgi:hypothetical protein